MKDITTKGCNMLPISTLPEALAELKRRIGRGCEGSELLAVAIKNNIGMHAARPLSALVETKQIINGELVMLDLPRCRGHALAALDHNQLRELSICNETTTRYPFDHTNHKDNQNGVYKRFTEPVHVTRENLRITDESLEKIIAILSHEGQAKTAAKVEAESDTTPSAVKPVKSISKGRVIGAFKGLHFSDDKWDEEADRIFVTAFSLEAGIEFNSLEGG